MHTDNQAAASLSVLLRYTRTLELLEMPRQHFQVTPFSQRPSAKNKRGTCFGKRGTAIRLRFFDSNQHQCINKCQFNGFRLALRLRLSPDPLPRAPAQPRLKREACLPAASSAVVSHANHRARYITTTEPLSPRFRCGKTPSWRANRHFPLLLPRSHCSLIGRISDRRVSSYRRAPGQTRHSRHQTA